MLDSSLESLLHKRSWAPLGFKTSFSKDFGMGWEEGPEQRGGKGAGGNLQRGEKDENSGQRGKSQPPLQRGNPGLGESKHWDIPVPWVLGAASLSRFYV